MKSQTKKKRANLVLEIFKENHNLSMSLSGWLEFLNKILSGHYTLKNTKELAHMFRYMRLSMNVNLIQEGGFIAYVEVKHDGTLGSYL